ncbi:MAG TPA: DUF1638 domain-containing protein [Acidimicrobiales bacterium]|jgi:hypothetical protein|nr:DUF1638 domain-containing protein [Acidimicrobiales bacterium]
MTPLSINSRSRAKSNATLAVVACGALGPSINEIVTRRSWHLDVHQLPALLHNRPSLIAPKVEQIAQQLQAGGQTVAVAYADCGTYGALDEVCDRLGIGRLHGQHCYDVFAKPESIQALFAEEPGSYLLTDFLVKTFRKTVISELGLDRHPELWGDYFGNYRRVIWLAQHRTPALEAEVRSIVERFGLPLVIVDVGTISLEVELEALLGTTHVTSRDRQRSDRGA